MLRLPQVVPLTSDRTSWISACIGIGSNLDNPVAQVRQALVALETIDETRLIAKSSLYRNPPMGPVDQPHYINAVATVLTGLSPSELLARLQALERLQGRVRKARDRWGPRCLDLDILTYGDRAISERDLQIPHPGISERNFVLFPLLEIAPQLQIPGLGPISSLVLELDGSALEKIP
jgi:2-amino-4-hydroxy-6-hydroxymethyldihydropteridine diphosphokinase